MKRAVVYRFRYLRQMENELLYGNTAAVAKSEDYPSSQVYPRYICFPLEISVRFLGNAQPHLQLQQCVTSMKDKSVNLDFDVAND